MKLKVGQCACARNHRVYCRTPDGYRFKARKCVKVGKIDKSR